MFTPFKTHVRSWIAGLHSRFFCAPPAGECEAGALAFYHPVLEEIGERYNCWRGRETDREFAFKISVEITDRLNQLDADLERVLNHDRR